jgi:hypothetical protein
LQQPWFFIPKKLPLGLQDFRGILEDAYK